MTTWMRAALLPATLLLVSCSQRPSDPRSPAPARSSDVVLTADDIDRAPGQSLEQLLLARVPGLTLTRSADGRMVLHLRGTSTILGEDEPLFVVNDIPLGPNASGNLSAINPRDIDWVKVLRDAAATAAYGARGANGVIVIRTKT
jgi:TonB-dependent starch-binding outer membrane protein SusC